MGFHFGNKGLHFIIVSFIFYEEGKPLKKSDVLGKSEVILKELKQLYGYPIYSYPWDGTYFHHIWSKNGILIEYAWDGGNGWGIQFRSSEHNEDAKKILQEIPHYPRK